MTLNLTPTHIGVMAAFVFFLLAFASHDPALAVAGFGCIAGGALLTWTLDLLTWTLDLHDRIATLEETLRHLSDLPENPDFNDGYAMTDLRKHLMSLADRLPPKSQPKPHSPGVTT